MDIVRNTMAGGSASPDAAIETELASLVDVYGLAILQVPEQIKLRLAQAQPDAQRQIDAVLSALEADVPQRLRKAHDDERLDGLLEQLVKRVEDHGSLDAATASWAVRAWAHALALPTASLEKTTSPQDSSVAREFAAVVTPLSNKRTAAVGKEPPVRATDAQAPAVVEPAIVEPAIVEPAIVESAFVESAFVESAFVESAFVEPVVGDPEVVVPTVAVPAVIEPAIVVPAVASASSADAVAVEDAPGMDRAAGAVETQTPLPPEPPRASRAPTGRRTLAIGAVLAVIVLAIFLGVGGARWLSSGTTSVQPQAQSHSQPPMQSRMQPPVQPPAQRDSSIADATPRTTQATPSPRPAAPSPTAVADAEPRAPASAASSAAPSAASSGAQRPTITRVDVPRVVVGTPFTVAIRVSTGANDIAAIESKVVDGSAIVPRAASVTARSALRRSKNGALLVPFKAIAAPSYATIEFTAVDRNGLRSEPKRAALNVAAAPALATSSYCTRSTCGTVVAIRELDAGSIGRPADRGARMYEVIIRMDDRTIHKATVPDHWSTGTWVQMVGGRFVSMTSGPR